MMLDGVDEGWIHSYRKLRDASDEKLPFWAPFALLFSVNVLMFSLTIFAPAKALVAITVYVGTLLLVYKIPLVYGTFRGLRHWALNAKRDYRQELLRRRMNDELDFPPNFGGLVLGCIDADFCK